MLRKEELRKLRTLRVTPAIKDKARGNEEKFEEEVKYSLGTYKRQYNRKYGCLLRCQNLGAYLKIAVFYSVEVNAGQLDPHYEVFINPETGEYITRILKDGKEIGWSSSMIQNLEVPYRDYSYWYHSYKNSWINPEGAQTIKRLLKSNCTDALDAVEHFQSRARKERRDRQYDKNIEKWKKETAVPELTESMSEWLRKEVVQEQFIFYKYDRKGVKEGFCTYCEKMVPMPPRYKNNLKTHCPVCKKVVELKSIGNRKSLTTRWHYGTIMRYAENGNLVIQRFSVRNSMELPFTSVRHVIEEDYRFVYDGKKVTEYVFDYYKKYKICWHQEKYRSYYRINCGKIYKKNLRTLTHGLLKRSGLIEMIRQNKLGDRPPHQWLKEELGNPLLEQLPKLGMCRLAGEIADMRYDRKFLNESATSTAGMLQLDKARLKRLKEFGKKANIYHVKWLQYEKQQNTQYADELIDFFSVNEVSYHDFSFLPAKMGWVEIKNYLTKQAALSHDTVHQTVGTWRDYMNMAEKLKMQTTVEQIYKPANLSAKHTELVEMFKNEDMRKMAKELEKQWPEVNEVLSGLQKYCYTDDMYVISVPLSVYEIVREGMLLSHCIHTADYYWDRISRRESYIVFLRKASKPDVPWYTLEIEPGGVIRQKRTIGDNQNPDLKPAEPFLKKWQKELKKVLTKEDYELAERSRELRLKGYKELRDKGERIRKGKLAGQLLADVLEADLMDDAV